MKLLYTIGCLFLTTLVFAQKTTLFQNVNVRAKELKHNLNEAGDSLIFKCERTVYEAVIFNDDFERVIKVRDTEVAIPIADIPVGRYIVEALLSDKLIVMTLLRNEPFDSVKNSPLVTDTSDLFGRKTNAKKETIASVDETQVAPKIKLKEAVAEATPKLPKPQKAITGSESSLKKTDLAVAGKKAKPKVVKKRLAVTKKQPAKNSDLSLFKSEPKFIKKKMSNRSTENVDKARTNRIESTYWVEYIINNGSSEQKVQKLGDQQTVDRMIRKIEIDMKTRAGQLNELTVWTVYDPSKFVKHKKMNKHNFTAIPSESFNIEPYFKKVNKTGDL